ncbi:MAG: DNA recombination protein RmuC [Muribaculaceae bacterium]|nr:DNA recombination protein RmuC [Muribaculaceae bacterium]
MEAIIYLCVAVLTGVTVFALTAIYFNRRIQGIRDTENMQEERNRLETRRLLETQRNEMEQRLQHQQNDMEKRLQDQQAEMERRLSRQSEQAAEQARLHFTTIGQEILRKQSETLKAQNKEEFAMALDPVRTKLEEFSKAVNESYVKETADRKSLSDQIERLMKLNNDIGQEARNLTTALKGDSKIQGDWGEMVLQTLLESAGMVEGENFFTQVTRDETGRTLTDEEGNMLRPDVVVNLPDNHKIVIDSKVSLKAYTEYVSAAGQPERETAGKRHIISITGHINELGDKKYQSHIKKAADHVMMFIPNEGAYYAAMQIKPDLWKYAYDKNVVMVSPTHLFSVMQIVAQLWKQDRQNKYALDIAKAGGELYDRFVDFYNDMSKVEKSLQDVVKNFDRCRQDVENRVGIAAKAKKLRELGANATKNLPE